MLRTFQIIHDDFWSFVDSGGDSRSLVCFVVIHCLSQRLLVVRGLALSFLVMRCLRCGLVLSVVVRCGSYSFVAIHNDSLTLLVMRGHSLVMHFRDCLRSDILNDYIEASHLPFNNPNNHTTFQQLHVCVCLCVYVCHGVDIMMLPCWVSSILCCPSAFQLLFTYVWLCVYVCRGVDIMMLPCGV